MSDTYNSYNACSCHSRPQTQYSKFSLDISLTAQSLHIIAPYVHKQ